MVIDLTEDDDGDNADDVVLGKVNASYPPLSWSEHCREVRGQQRALF